MSETGGKKTARGRIPSSDVLVTLFLLLVTALPALMQRCPLFVYQVDEFDDSWGVDLVHRALNGMWLGKDALYTRGPLFQALLALPALLQGESLCSYYRYLWMLQYWSVIIPLFFAARFLLRHEAAWKRAFLIAIVTLFWLPLRGPLSMLRVTVPLCALAIFMVIFEGLNSEAKKLWMRGAAVATLLALSFLISVDTGFYSIVALVAVAASSLMFRDHRRALLPETGALLAIICLFAAVWVLAINSWAATPFDFIFWRNNQLLLQPYRWSLPTAMNSGGAHPTVAAVFWCAFVLCLAIFLFGFFWSGNTALAGKNRARAAAMAVFSIAVLQAGIVFAEWFHVLYALVPMLALAFAVLLGAARLEGAPARPFAAVLAIVVVTAAVTGPEHHFIGTNVVRMLLPQPARGCPSETVLFDGICLEPEQGRELQEVSAALTENSRSGDSILVYPQENVFAVSAGRDVAGAVLQNSVAIGKELTALQLRSIQEGKPPLALYVTSEDWQGIPNFTRSPSVWFYLQQHYRAEQKFDSVVLLRRDDARAGNVQLTTEPLSGGGIAPVRSGEEIELAGSVPVTADFLRLELKFSYPWYWKLLKPARLVAHLRLDDGRHIFVPFIAPPNQNYEVWINPWGEQALLNFLQADPAKWRSDPPARIAGIGLQISRMDWASVLPRDVEITSVAVIHVGIKPAQATSSP